MTRNDDLVNRSLAIVLLLALILCGWLLMVQPYLELRRSAAQRVDDMVRQREQLWHAGQAREQRMAQLRAALEDPQHDPLFLPSQRPAMAAAELQQLLRERIDLAGGQLVSIQSLPVETNRGLVPIHLRVILRGSSETLRQLLHGLETATPMIGVEELSIRRIATGRLASHDAGEQLDVRLLVVGYLRSDQA